MSAICLGLNVLSIYQNMYRIIMYFKAWMLSTCMLFEEDSKPPNHTLQSFGLIRRAIA